MAVISPLFARDMKVPVLRPMLQAAHVCRIESIRHLKKSTTSKAASLLNLRSAAEAGDGWVIWTGSRGITGRQANWKDGDETKLE